MLNVDFVLETHDDIIKGFGGLQGFAQDKGALESALHRVENHIAYSNVTDPFEIAALYSVAIARGHIFSDGNKRTALVCVLAYLDLSGIYIPATSGLDDVMVEIGQGSKDYQWFAQYLASLARTNK